MFTIGSISALAQDSGKNPLVLEAFRMIDELNKEGQRSIIIEFTFSKNVVNMEVSDKNSNCFKVVSKDDGGAVSLKVEMADDQIEREKRNNINIIIKDVIESLKTYQIIISPELESKSGEKLGEELVLEFMALGKAK
jgi:uncharacterized protein YfaS (alpha-2-macroglobulin family)